MNKLKWHFDKDENEVATENNVTVFYTDELECPNSVIEKIVDLHNNSEEGNDLIGSGGIIDEYLLDEAECTQEDREIICDEIYNYILSLSSPIKRLLMEKTLFIADSDELEKVRDIFQLKGEPTLWAYDHSFNEDDTVSSGFLHYDGVFILSKERSEKSVLTIVDLFKIK